VHGCTPTVNPSSPPFPDHLGLVATRSLLFARRAVCLLLVTNLGIRMLFVRLVTFVTIRRLGLSPVRGGRVLRSLAEYDAISNTILRHERHNTTISGFPTTAFRLFGELQGQRIRTRSSWILGDMSQHEDNRTRWTVYTDGPLMVILQSVKVSPVPSRFTFADLSARELFLPLKTQYQLTGSPVKKWT
jgi:hypothetical protein